MRWLATCKLPKRDHATYLVIVPLTVSGVATYLVTVPLAVSGVADTLSARDCNQQRAGGPDSGWTVVHALQFWFMRHRPQQSPRVCTLKGARRSLFWYLTPISKEAHPPYMHSLQQT